MTMEFVHIWLGSFQSPKAFEDYLEEQYEDDERSINQFAEDQGERFYDHDWVESNFKVIDNLEELVMLHSYSGSYGEEVLKKAAGLDIEIANAFIMADSEEFTAPKSKQTANYTLHYLGRFKTTAKL